MRVEQCGCGEKFVSSEAHTKLLNHWKHQRKCLFSYIGCVSYLLFEHIAKVRAIFGFRVPEIPPIGSMKVMHSIFFVSFLSLM